jgi:hypothetical protein
MDHLIMKTGGCGKLGIFLGWNRSIQNRIKQKKGSHDSDLFTSTTTDLLCSPYVHAFSSTTF